MTNQDKSMKRKSIDITDSSSIPTKRLSLLSNENYCSESDILFSKKDNHHSSSYKSISFNRPIQIGQFIYVPIPMIPSQMDTSNQDNKPLDLSKPKTINNECEKSINSPLDLSTEKRKKIVQEKLYQCQYCSIYFRSWKTLHAHQENYCNEHRKQKIKENNRLTDTIDNKG
jgi:hypothetical protein